METNGFVSKEARRKLGGQTNGRAAVRPPNEKETHMSTRKFFPAAAAVISAVALTGGVAGASAATAPMPTAVSAQQAGATAAVNALNTGATAAVNAWNTGAAAGVAGLQAGANALGTLATPGPIFGGPAPFPSFINYGPTGPLGPLGAKGPLGTNSNLPTGWSAFNLGPTGPLGPAGPLG
jgi:hypothetical protein